MSPSGAPATLETRFTVLSMGCPSAHQCTTVDGAGAVITFDPAAPAGAAASQADPREL